MNKILIAGAAGALVLGGVAIAQTTQGQAPAQSDAMQSQQQPDAMQNQPGAAGDAGAANPGAMSATDAAEDTAAGSDMQYAGERG
ncbi:MAG: hypothetical protein WCY15_07710 [Phenylobacterium sp.]|jgi:uncharacterized low-complexity protein|uniref:hypothetical protein n=1 Tax=Phenylobacterium sp. TaxID=1871053 RepID=UPI002A271385|nr:hypothetical protein [Phenylobacterium sp.]MDD3837209.1 hypothetical protein [Phenylobacterium sp.]MDX9997443.1 hypothetical protein [Phenylobacterium sp.]